MMKNKLAHDVSLCCLLFRNPLFQTVNNCHPRCVRVAAILFVIYMLPYSFFAPLTRLKTREINASDDFVGSTLVVAFSWFFPSCLSLSVFRCQGGLFLLLFWYALNGRMRWPTCDMLWLLLLLFSSFRRV